MRYAFPLLLATVSAFAAGCAGPPPPVSVNLVPPDALASLLPDSVGAYGAVGDEVHRGYFADSAGALALVTVARTYRHGQFLMALNVSSFDQPERYRAVVTEGGGRAAPDSVLHGAQGLVGAGAAGWELYAVQYGWLLLHPSGRAVEAKALLDGMAGEALGHLDLPALAALAEAPTVVDSAFTRAVERGRASGPREEGHDEAVRG